MTSCSPGVDVSVNGRADVMPVVVAAVVVGHPATVVMVTVEDEVNSEYRADDITTPSIETVFFPSSSTRMSSRGLERLHCTDGSAVRETHEALTSCERAAPATDFICGIYHAGVISR